MSFGGPHDARVCLVSRRRFRSSVACSGVRLMGYAWNGVCYQDTASALAAFTKDVPNIDASGINSFTTSPTISGSGLISWAITNRPLNAASDSAWTGSTQLLSCASELMDQYPVQSVLLIVALFFAAFAGFRTGFRP